jgi:hypothetical protein
MSLEFIAQIILAGTFAGLVFMIAAKIPSLTQLRVEEGGSNLRRSLIRTIGSRVLAVLPSFNLLFQKMLVKLRIIFLKLERWLEAYLQGLRQRNKTDKVNRTDKYWQELKKSQNRARPK